MRASRAGQAIALAVALPLALTACGDGEPETSEVAAPDPAPGSIALAEVTSIGCAECPLEEQVSVWALTVGAEGRIWAVDRYPPHMRVFGRDGRLVAAFGPTGQGPGDFMSGPMDTMMSGAALLPAPAARVLAYQIYPPSFVELNLEGAETDRRSIDWPDPFGRIAMAMGREPDGGHVYALTSSQVAARNGEPFDIRRLDPAGDPVSVELVASGRDLFPEWDPDERYLRVWFAMAVAPDGTLAVGNSLTYEIVRLTVAGQVAGRFRHEVERPLFSEEALEALRRSARRNDRPEEDIDPRDVHFGRSSFEFDDRGRLWVVVNRPTRDRSVFDVFAPDGTFLQQVEIPDYIRHNGIRGVGPAFVVSDGHMFAAVVGPDDEDRIKVWRVVDGR